MKKKQLSFLFCGLIFCLFLTSCHERKDVEKQAYVVSIGLDKSKKDKLLEVSYLIANPEFGALQTSSGNEPPKQIITIEATDFISSKEVANTMIPKQLTYDLLENIFISEELAREKDIISWMYDTSTDNEIRRNINLIITREETSEFLKNTRPKIEQYPHEYFHFIIESASKIGYIPSNSQLLQYFRILEAKGDLFLATYASTKKDTHNKSTTQSGEFLAGDFEMTGEEIGSTQFAGSAVFKNGVMVGTLNSKETQIATFLNNTVPSLSFITTFSDPFDKNLDIAVKINSDRGTHLDMNFDVEPGQIKAELPLEIEILSNHSFTDYNKKENRKKLLDHLTSQIEKEIEKLVIRTQNELKGNPFGWSLLARRQFTTLEKYRAYDFQKKYPEMDIQVNCELFILDYGRQKDIIDKKEAFDND